MYYEFGIFSTIYNGRWMPFCIRHVSMGTSISFTIPSHPKKLRGLNFCYTGKLFELPMIKVRNITKNFTWIYMHCIKSFYVDGDDQIFLSHWMFGKNEMGVGDEITINLENHIKDPKPMCRCGVGLVYDDDERMELIRRYTRYTRSCTNIKNEALSFSHWVLAMHNMDNDDIITTQPKCIRTLDDENIEEEGPLDYYKSWNHIIGGDLSAFRLTTGEYFLNSVEFLRSLFSSSFPNAHFTERTVWFAAFSPKKSDILDRASEERIQEEFAQKHQEEFALMLQHTAQKEYLSHVLDEQRERTVWFAAFSSKKSEIVDGAHKAKP
ncbi:hypothetical protein R6Q59_023931 [Mikania micrantha]